MMVAVRFTHIQFRQGGTKGAMPLCGAGAVIGIFGPGNECLSKQGRDAGG